MRVFGIDPGSGRTGYGCVDSDGSRHRIVTFEGAQVEKGYIRVSEKPGIGVDINEEAMRRYAVPGVPFFA